MSIVQSRREFIRQALAAGTATLTAARAIAPNFALAAPSPNEKLNIGCIGVGGQGEYNLNSVASENIVALCDIDSQRLAKAAERFPQAKTYDDYRKLLDQRGLDAVVVAVPDHSHAIAVIGALRRGLDVYCEKPLAHDVYEVRQIREWTAKQKAVTQMGTQIHAGDNYRRVVEAIKGGAIGKVSRVHVWVSGGPSVPRPGKRVEKSTPPAHVNYDLWIGPAPMRPFHDSHFHFNWRYWWDFGGGALGDFGCHYMDLAFWALDLGSPTSVVAQGEKTYTGDNEVPDNMKVDYDFPARGEQPPVHLTWYHGEWRPKGTEAHGYGAAVLFEGDRGRLIADYGSRKVVLSSGLDFKEPPPSIPASIGHHQEWIAACKNRGPTTCNFDYSGGLTEAVLLGNVAYRAGKKLEWDAAALRAKNCPEAGQFIRREYRAGWTL
jgi:predicted dehydrogenase